MKIKIQKHNSGSGYVIKLDNDTANTTVTYDGTPQKVKDVVVTYLNTLNSKGPTVGEVYHIWSFEGIGLPFVEEQKNNWATSIKNLITQNIVKPTNTDDDEDEDEEEDDEDAEAWDIVRDRLLQYNIGGFFVDPSSRTIIYYSTTGAAVPPPICHQDVLNTLLEGSI